uniref:C-type lectin domain-containing protein n=1 Tax=Mola mola TaxID=94237 RepID=A0A3Q3VNW2_MOLML
IGRCISVLFLFYGNWTGFFSPGDLRCPGLDWYEFGEFCYKPFDDKQTWHEARSTCRSLGAELVSIRSMTEQSWLESYLYLGVDQTRYRPDPDTAISWTEWFSINTNSLLSLDNGDGTCVAMTSGRIGGFWDDKPCSDKYFFMCEKPRSDITPPTQAPTSSPSQGCASDWTTLPHFRNCYKVCNRPQNC